MGLTSQRAVQMKLVENTLFRFIRPAVAVKFHLIVWVIRCEVFRYLPERAFAVLGSYFKHTCSLTTKKKYAISWVRASGLEYALLVLRMSRLVFDSGHPVGERQSPPLVLGAPLHSLAMLTMPSRTLFEHCFVHAAIPLNDCTIGLAGPEPCMCCIDTVASHHAEVLIVFFGVSC